MHSVITAYESGSPQVATPPVTEEVILEENVIVPAPPVIEQTEVENTEAATNNTTHYKKDTSMTFWAE